MQNHRLWKMAAVAGCVAIATVFADRAAWGQDIQLTGFALASDAGYGFVAALSDLHSKNRSGKAMLTLPSGALPLPPAAVRKLNRPAWLIR